jgi:hypothetical protein
MSPCCAQGPTLTRNPLPSWAAFFSCPAWTTRSDPRTTRTTNHASQGGRQPAPLARRRTRRVPWDDATTEAASNLAGDCRIVAGREPPPMAPLGHAPESRADSRGACSVDLLPLHRVLLSSGDCLKCSILIVRDSFRHRKSSVFYCALAFWFLGDDAGRGRRLCDSRAKYGVPLRLKRVNSKRGTTLIFNDPASCEGLFSGGTVRISNSAIPQGSTLV